MDCMTYLKNIKKVADRRNIQGWGISLVLVLFFVTDLYAQDISWTEVTSDYGFTESIQMYEGRRNSPALNVWYAKVDISQDSIALVPWLTEKGSEKITNFSQRKGAYVAINGGFFGGSNSYSALVQAEKVLAQNVGALTRNGESYPVMRSLFSLDTQDSMHVDWIYHFGSRPQDIFTFESPMNYSQSDDPKPAPEKANGKAYSDLYSGIGGAPTLVKNGERNVTYDEEIMWGSGVGLTNQDPRTAVGYTADGHAILLVADGRSGQSDGVSLTELADIMIELGCVEAMNLDGGGSTQMTANGGLVNDPSDGQQREVPTFLTVVHRDTAPTPPEPAKEVILDTEMEDTVTVTGDWIETANAGFYGDSRSLVKQGGDGSATVSYKPDLPEEGTYQVAGWWVAAGNRSTKTPYVVIHSEGRDTVRKNQSTNGSKWVSVGEYNFSADGSAEVIISDASGQPDNYVVADAVRFRKVEDTAIPGESIAAGNPQIISLHSNYPNPFNPATNIRFKLGEAADVRVEVYSILGQKLETLTAQKFSAGAHSLSWDAGQRASGIYLYRIVAQNRDEIQRIHGSMTLVR